MIDWKSEWKKLVWIAAVFILLFYLPVESTRFENALMEALHLVKWYAREHVLLCLIPAFYIAGAISVFISQASVMKYLGANANKYLAYSVASVSGTILAVCSCTVLPLFAGIYSMGAGLGPASAFLYSGPAINVLAIVLTARVLGLEIGFARAGGAIVFSVLIGLAMHLIFRKEEQQKSIQQAALPAPEIQRPLWQNMLYFASMIGILVFANWARPESESGIWYVIFSVKWRITSAFGIALGLFMVAWLGLAWRKLLLAAVPTAILAILFHNEPLIPFTAASLGLAVITSTEKGELGEWFAMTWGFTKQVLPLLLLGVLISGALLGRPGHDGLIPASWISNSVGGNHLFANMFAALAGAFMYFATLTEVPILQGLIGSGMGKGPALALLLAGPALSLPSMLVLKSIMGTRKTLVFIGLVVLMATVSGLLFGTVLPD